MILRLENLEAADKLTARFRMLVNPNAEDLMLTWKNIIERDNRRGVLAGLDKDGNPLAPVTYRPIGTPEKHRRKKGKNPWESQQDQYGNLPSSLYRRLDGPPLAPRGVFSRVITNLQTDSAPMGGGKWAAWGIWQDVVARDGRTKFLKFHFYGIGQIRRDLTGVRPEGVAQARRAAVNWMMDIVRSGGV